MARNHTDLDIAVAVIEVAHSMGNKPGMVNAKHAKLVLDRMRELEQELATLKLTMPRRFGS